METHCTNVPLTQHGQYPTSLLEALPRHCPGLENSPNVEWQWPRVTFDDWVASESNPIPRYHPSRPHPPWEQPAAPDGFGHILSYCCCVYFPLSESHRRPKSSCISIPDIGSRASHLQKVVSGGEWCHPELCLISTSAEHPWYETVAKIFARCPNMNVAYLEILLTKKPGKVVDDGGPTKREPSTASSVIIFNRLLRRPKRDCSSLFRNHSNNAPIHSTQQQVSTLVYGNFSRYKTGTYTIVYCSVYLQF